LEAGEFLGSEFFGETFEVAAEGQGGIAFAGGAGSGGA